MGEAAEVLLLVVLANGELVVYEVVALDSYRGEVMVVDLLELLKLLVEDLVEDGHQAALLRLQALLLDGREDGDAQTCLLDYAFHCDSIQKIEPKHSDI